MTTEQLVRNPIVTGRVTADIASQSPRDVVAAMFSFDLDDGKVDLDAVERIREREFDDWISATARSGLFSPQEIEALARSWHADPPVTVRGAPHRRRRHDPQALRDRLGLARRGRLTRIRLTVATTDDGTPDSQHTHPQ